MEEVGSVSPGRCKSRASAALAPLDGMPPQATTVNFGGICQRPATHCPYFFWQWIQTSLIPLPCVNFLNSVHFCAGKDFASAAVNKPDSGLVEWESDFGRWFQKQLPGHPSALVQIRVSGQGARATALVNLGNFFRLDPEHQHRLSSSSIALQLPPARLPNDRRDSVLSLEVPLL